jgi:hypothetical protein
MTVPGRIVSFLRENVGKRYCDKCITDALKLSQPQQTNTVTLTLEHCSGFSYTEAECSVCRKWRKTTCAPERRKAN